MEKIILVDSTSNFENIKNFFKKENNLSIISFDYKSHKKLENGNIPHQISDDYITDLQCKTIQDYVYKFTYWYFEKDFSKFLEYREINLGRLFQDELLNFFVRFLKKFKEIEIIFASNQNKEFLAENELFDIIQFFTNSTLNLQKSTKKFHSFPHEEMRVNLKIAGYEKSLFLSRDRYLKLKKLTDFLINNMFNPKITDNTKTKILFAEYNTERYKELFLKSKKFNAEIFFYGKRRPAFWNGSTLKTIRNSKCKIITNHLIYDNVAKHEEKLGIKKMQTQLSELWKKNSSLEKFFTFGDFEVFTLIKPVLVELIENRLSHTIHEIELVNRMFQKIRFDFSVIINELGFSEQIISCLSKTYKVKCIHMQEGFHWDTIAAHANLTSQGAYLHDADTLAVWGDIDRSISIENGGIPSNKVRIIGAPRYDNLFNSETKKQDYILLASSGDPQPEEVNGIRINKIEEYLTDILQISKIVRELDEEVFIKLHPSPTQLMDLVELGKKIDPKITIVSHGEITSLLPSAKLVISIGMSSAIIEALILKKPVIFIPGIDYNWGDPSIINEKGCLISSISELKDDLKGVLNNTKLYAEQQNSSRKYLSKLISHHGNASDEFYKYLKNYTI
ncbi:MAG: hypothetical protein NZ747_03010 [Nitrosopumilus sp.]|nr:hypothetical protein [Nitrosopumilus sp.]